MGLFWIYSNHFKFENSLSNINIIFSFLNIALYINVFVYVLKILIELLHISSDDGPTENTKTHSVTFAHQNFNISYMLTSVAVKKTFNYTHVILY